MTEKDGMWTPRAGFARKLSEELDIDEQLADSLIDDMDGVITKDVGGSQYVLLSEKGSTLKHGRLKTKYYATKARLRLLELQLDWNGLDP